MCGMWTRSLLNVITSRETTSGSENPWALMEAERSMRLSCFVHVDFLVASPFGQRFSEVSRQRTPVSQYDGSLLCSYNILERNAAYILKIPGCCH